MATETSKPVRVESQEAKIQTRHRWSRIVIAGAILAGFGWMFSPFFTAILLAALFGFALEPIVSRYPIQKKRRGLSTAVLIFGFFVMIALPLVFVVHRIIIKAREVSKVGFENTPLFASLNKVTSSISGKMTSLADRFGLAPDTVPDMNAVISNAGSWLVTGTTAFVGQLPDFILGVFVFVAALYFFLTEAKTIKKGLGDLNILKSDELHRITRVIQRSSYTSFITTMVIGAIQALIVALAALFCGYKEFLIVFVITFVVSMIPVVGAAPVAVLLAALSFMQGESGAGIGLLVTAVVAGSIDNILRPLIVNASEEDLHPVVSLLAVIGAVIVYGIPGLFLGPILTQLAFKVIPILFHEEDTEPSPAAGSVASQTSK